MRYQKRACGLHRRAPVSGALLFGTIEVCVMGLRARAEVPQGVTEINMIAARSGFRSASLRKRLRYQKRACGLHRRAPVSGARLFGTIEVCVMGLRARAEVPQGVLEAHKPTETNQQTFARFPPGPCWTLPEPPVSPMIPCGRRLFHFTACRDRTSRPLPYPCGLCHGRTWARGASKHHCERPCRKNGAIRSCCTRLRLQCCRT